MEKKVIMMLMFLVMLNVGGMAQTKKKKKSAAQLSKQYVEYTKDKAQGKEKLAEKKASDPATVTREKQDSIEQIKQKTFKDAYNEFRQMVQTDYENFREEANRKYAEFLKQAWDEYQIMPAIPKPKEKETPPVIMPEEDKHEPIEDNPLPIEEEVVHPPIPEPQPVPLVPIKEEPNPQEQYVSFTLYGTSMKVRFNESQRFTLPACNEEAVSNAWVQLSGTAYNNTIRDCLELRITLQLSDWAYLQMLEKMSLACLGETKEATLLMAYIYCQSGYKMRFGIVNEKLYMLYASKHAIYNIGRFELDGEYFYPFRFDGDRMQICKVTYPQERPLSLLIPPRAAVVVQGKPK